MDASQTPHIPAQQGENNPALAISTQEAIFQQTRKLVREHQGKFSATYIPNSVTVVTKFLGFALEVTIEHTEEITINSVVLLGDKGEEYKLEVSFGPKVKDQIQRLRNAIEEAGHESQLISEKLLNNYSESLGEEAAFLSDQWAEGTMPAPDALTILQNAKDFELPHGAAISLEDVMRQHPLALSMLLGETQVSKPV